MSSWSYRVLSHTTATGSWLAVHENYYDDKGTVTGWSEDAATISWTIEEDGEDGWKHLLMLINEACTLPVIIVRDDEATAVCE